MKKKHAGLLALLDGVAILLFIATFSPAVIPANQTDPELFGLSYTMWMGFLISVLFVVLAYLVSLINKENKHAD